MIAELFNNVQDSELKDIYEEILSARKDGLRPRCLDPYINKVRETYPLSVGEAWRYTEGLFWEEVAKRYFSAMKYLE